MDNHDTKGINILSTLKTIDRWSAPIDRGQFINLNLNESNFDEKDAPFFSFFTNFPSTVLSQYPEYDALLTELSHYTNMQSKQIILTNGADQGIGLICRLFFNDKSRVLIPSPVFSYYYHVLHLLGSKIVPVYYEKQADNFIFPIDGILKNISAADGVILCNPNNPLGTPISLEEIKSIATACQQQNIPCIIDEAYFEYHEESALPFLKDFKNLVVIRTFSKFFCLSGLRLGYVIADHNLIKELLKMRGSWDVNHFSVFAGILCLKNLGFFIQKKKGTNARKENLCQLLEEKGMHYTPSKTNFLTVKQPGQQLLHSFKDHNIIVNDLSNYPFSNGILANHLRITIPQVDHFNALLKALNTQE